MSADPHADPGLCGAENNSLGVTCNRKIGHWGYHAEVDAEGIMRRSWDAYGQIAYAQRKAAEETQPFDRWWTHGGSCGPTHGDDGGPHWPSCVGCGRPASELTWEVHP